jgi:small neutral amino acid transporter SnatA (MarC family)
MIKDYPFARQKQIMLREGVIALIVALFFQFFGEYFLSFLGIKMYSLALCGGVILTLTALKMIFAVHDDSAPAELKKEPMIVPIATPILTGPGLMTIIMIYSTKETNNLKITLSLLLAWVGVLSVLYTAPYLQKTFGKRGMTALEQIMGMILAFIAIEMVLSGAGNFIKQL